MVNDKTKPQSTTELPPVIWRHGSFIYHQTITHTKTVSVMSMVSFWLGKKPAQIYTDVSTFSGISRSKKMGYLIEVMD